MTRLTMFSFLVSCSIFLAISGMPIIKPEFQEPPPHQMTNKISESWTDERLCVLKMGSSCPSGFVEDKLKLSVQTDVNPKDTGRDGEQLIMMGQAGETSLTRNVYDALYTLTITTCCK